MGFRLALALSVAIIAYAYYQLKSIPDQIPKMDTNKYWGPGDGSNYVENTTIQDFKIIYEQEIINDLRRTLEKPLRLQEPLEGVAFQYGFNSRKVRPLVDYWRSIYLPKWKSRQQYLNQFNHYMTQINGLYVHFIHEKPRQLAPATNYIRLPLLLLHGWPGSVREFYDVIPKFTSYTDDHPFAFDVVVPSLVGYGFSSAAAKEGFGPSEMALIMRNLMIRLGYPRFLVQGGDWGSVIGSQLTTLFPENVLAYHSNMCILRSRKAAFKGMFASLFPSLFVKPENQYFHFPMLDKLKFILQESGYFHIQATKPDTIGAALANSPVGLLVYILEKFSTGTDKNNRELEDGGLDNMKIDMDAMLDNIMIYYLTNTITSSMRLYAESMTSLVNDVSYDTIRSLVPMGCVRFKNDLPSAFDWQLKDKFPNMVHSTYIHHGGHFAALELPDELYDDFIEFCTTVFTAKYEYT